ncbi:uncharacterized mitochondrial protein-like protein [Tanacetum coccineum]
MYALKEQHPPDTNIYDHETMRVFDVRDLSIKISVVYISCLLAFKRNKVPGVTATMINYGNSVMSSRKSEFPTIGEITFFLGLQVQQKEDEIFISQDKYVAKILKKFDFATVKIASTPMEPNKALVKDEEADNVDVHLYRSMIGSLMYLTASRPDITFVVCACARFQVTLKMSHLHVVKRIFRYLKGQPKLGLWYPRDSLLIPILDRFLSLSKV